MIITVFGQHHPAVSVNH